MTVALFFYLLAVTCWLGGMIFFSFFTAPVIFSRLPIAEAGKVINGIFPIYYILAYVAGGIALALAIYFCLAGRTRGWWLGASLCLAAALLLMVYAGAIVRPRVEAVRHVAEQQVPDPAAKSEFETLHRLSVQLNGAAMILELLALIATAGALA